MKLVKCHMAYLFNKNTLIILSIAIIIFGIALRENAMINSGTKSEIMNEYLSSCESLYRLLFTFISIFIFANSIYNPNDFYRYFILTKISRVKYLLSKIITNILIISGLSIFIYVTYLLLGFIKIKGFYWQKEGLISLLSLTIIAIIYGLYAFFLMQLFNNQFISIITFGFVIISNNLPQDSILLLLFPNDGHFGFIALIWLIMLLCLINLKIYEIKDLNT